jgi:hypothetical protein
MRLFLGKQAENNGLYRAQLITTCLGTDTSFDIFPEEP